MISEHFVIAEKFNDFFINIGKNVTSYSNLSKFDPLSSLSTRLEYLNDITVTYSNHMSIKKIESLQNIRADSLSFGNVTPEEIIKAIRNLDTRKSVSGPFSTSLVKMLSSTIHGPLTNCMNNCIFLPELEQAEVILIHKKGIKRSSKTTFPLASYLFFQRLNLQMFF